ncbi:MAG: hypothetical protein HY904_04760 [Deltaproteobacteria bacterium]|nr:hypothetical protein [Deltaproteobacteria bacterium]
MRGRWWWLFAVAVVLSGTPARAEVILQWFETPWREIEARMPEVALAGYRALWLPPPTKGADGAGDVGFAVFDRFDLGNRNQRGTTATRYGTLAELQSMVRAAHRYGVRVYFDTVMNHNSNPARVEFPGGPATPPTLLEYPGMTPLDFHLLPANPGPGAGEYTARIPTEMGGGTAVIRTTSGDDAYVVAVRIADIPAAQLPTGGVNHPALAGFTHLVQAPRMNFPNWPHYELFNYSLLGLVDIATEQGATPGVGPAAWDGTNYTLSGPTQAQWLRLPRYVRAPDRPETYPNQVPVDEDSREYLMRWIRWLSLVTDADGFRLDAIKHVPTEFFAEDWPGDPIAFVKGIQDSYDTRRGLTDSNDDDLVDDAAIFGESFSGEIAGDLSAYRRTGMRVLNFPLFFNIKGVFPGGSGGSLRLLASPLPADPQVGATREFGGMGRWDAVSFIQSHDECPPGTPARTVPRCDSGSNAQDDLAQLFVLMRVGDGVVYFDGNNFTESTFVRAGRPDALGDLTTVMPQMVRATEDTARGAMFNRFVDDDAYVFERVVDGRGAAALVVMHDGLSGVARFGGFDPRPLVVTAFPPGTVLEELTGNAVTGSETLTVLPPSGETQTNLTNAYNAHKAANEDDASLPTGHGLVWFGVNPGPTGNYLVYAPVGAVAPGAALEVRTGGAAAPTRQAQTVGPKSAFTGLAIPAATVTEHVVASSFSVRVPVAAAGGATAGVRLDGVVPAGTTGLTGTDEGQLDGYAPMAAAAGYFEANLANVPAGQHLLTVRVLTGVAGAAGRVQTLRALVNVSGAPPTDGGVTQDAAVVQDSGTPHDAAVVTDAAVTVDAGRDGGVTPDAAHPVDAGGGDAGALDPDNDGVPSATDNCPAMSNADQADFDQDHVGDVCDLCPHDDGAGSVDADGCRVIAPAQRERITRLLDMVVGNLPADLSLDEDLDGDLDAVDVARAVNRAQQR